MLYSSDSGPSVYRITTGKSDRTVSLDMTVFKASGNEALPIVISGDMCSPYCFDKEYIKTFTDNGINLSLFNRTVLFPDIAWYNTEKVIAPPYLRGFRSACKRYKALQI